MSTVQASSSFDLYVDVPSTAQFMMIATLGDNYYFTKKQTWQTLMYSWQYDMFISCIRTHLMNWKPWSTPESFYSRVVREEVGAREMTREIGPSEIISQQPEPKVETPTRVPAAIVPAAFSYSTPVTDYTLSPPWIPLSPVATSSMTPSSHSPSGSTSVEGPDSPSTSAASAASAVSSDKIEIRSQLSVA